MGSAREREQWLERLRERFVAVARRRLPEDAVEDVVQDALGIVWSKSGDLPGPDPAWCFQVLRNTIGNFYQKRRVREREPDLEHVHPERPGSTPLEALHEADVDRLLRESVRALATEHADCARWVERLLEGHSPADLAQTERVEPAVMYRRIYRCRGRLREILRGKGVVA